jgi:carotenoid cleavage dioxygenase-like enzyme
LPTVPPQNVGKASRYTYLSTYRQGTDISKEILNAIARFDHQTEKFTSSDCGENRYPSEPIYVQDAENPNQEIMAFVPPLTTKWSLKHQIGDI